MKEKINNIRNNKVLKNIIRVVKAIIVVFILVVVTIILVQRFSNNNLSVGGYRIYTIISESMLPRYELSDMLLAKEVTIDEIKVGDDIVYEGEKGGFKDKTVVHEIISKKKTNGKWVIITKGLANDIEDPAIGEDQIIGKIIYKSVMLSFISRIINSLYGFYFIIFLPVAILIFIEIIRTINEKKQEKLDKEKQTENKETNDIKE